MIIKLSRKERKKLKEVGTSSQYFLTECASLIRPYYKSVLESDGE